MSIVQNYLKHLEREKFMKKHTQSPTSVKNVVLHLVGSQILLVI